MSLKHKNADLVIQMSNELLNAALLYASIGWPVFPMLPRSKAPATTHGFKDATTDEKQIRKWWSKNPNYNIGIATGNGLGVIDVDDKPKNPIMGSDMLREWELEHGELAETCRVITGTGGVHYYYDLGKAKIPKCESDTIFIDLRCEGACVVAPPSIHPDTGIAYEWEISPEEMSLTKVGDVEKACFQWVYDNRKGASEDGEHNEFKAPEIVHEGEGRDTTLYKMACSMWSKNMPESTILAALLDYNEKCCKPPMPRRIVEQKVRSATRKPPGINNETTDENGKAVTKPKIARHVSVARKIMNKYSACYIDGAPSIFNGLSYETGWHSIERAILQEWGNAKDRERKEVIKYLDLVMPEKNQSPARYIGFTNGVLDIETMELLSFTPELCIPNVIPHDWNPDAQSDVIDDTFKRIACGDPFIESNLFEFVGLCMYRSAKYAFAAILLGRQNETASNGKSTYIDLIRNVLGKQNYSSLSLHALGEHFMQEFLAGKLANLGDDISSEFTKGASLEVFKKSVSGSAIHTDVKNSKGYEFTPYCTMIFSANEFPKMENLDDGILRRLFPIRFNAHFTSADPDFDPDIGEKLAQEEAIEACIVRGIQGLKRVIEQRRPTDNDESREMLKNIKADNSTILQWIEDDSVSKDDLIGNSIGHVFGLYSKWCSSSGVRNGYAKWNFSKKLCSYYGLRIQNTTRNGRSVRILAEAKAGAK